MDFSNEFHQVQNSIVRVLSIQGTGLNQQILSVGSGVLVGNGSKALTCSHCILPHTQTIVAFSGQNTGHIATLIFNDPALDIAVLEFQNPIGQGVIIGDSNLLRIGQETFVAGFPMYSTTITTLFAHIAGFEIYNNNQLIKIDSSVNHGNSGGPLFNMQGQLIGIINSKLGNLSAFLTQIEQANPQMSMAIGGIDPVQVMQHLIKEMKRTLNLGVGTAIPLSLVGNATNHIGALINANP